MLNPVKIRLLYGCAIKYKRSCKHKTQCRSLFPSGPFPQNHADCSHTHTDPTASPKRAKLKAGARGMSGEILVCSRGLLFSRCRGTDGTVISSLLIFDINSSFLKWHQSSDPWNPCRQVLTLGHRLLPPTPAQPPAPGTRWPLPLPSSV